MSTAGPLSAERPERVAVVIPAKNEAERIEATIHAARAIHGVDLVVVVDDGSTDSTAAVAMGADALVVRHRANRGKAAAMATGAQLVALREDAERADGGADFREELHAEPRVPGHTGPLPVIRPDGDVPHALLFLDADMGESASAAQPLVDAVLEDGVDMAIALLPPQDGASGMGIVVRTSRNGIERATGWAPIQPLSGTRCITREVWEECQPLAAGWGVETSLTIDALSAGFWVKEIDCDLHHRATGRDLRGQLHRAAQLRDVLRALARRRHLAPPEPEAEPASEDASGVGPDTDPGSVSEGATDSTPDSASDGAWPEADAVAPVESVAAEAEPSAEPAPAAQPPVAAEPAAGPVAAESVVAESVVDERAADEEDDEPEASAWTVVAEDPAPPVVRPHDQAAEERFREDLRVQLTDLPVEGEFSAEQVDRLEDTDLGALDRALRALPVEGDFAPDDIAYLVGTDLAELGERLRTAPVTGAFEPTQAVIIASHLDLPHPELPRAIRPPLTPDEYTSLVVHAAVEAENS
ncbi:glycosyltransferase family 2 protein [Brachybacterium sp. DNPG3]